MSICKPVKALIFDWGDTVMRDFRIPGPMAEWDEVAYIPGVENTLQELSSKYPCIIATSADHSGTEEMIEALKRVGAHRYFHYFFSSKELGYQKPDPKFFSAITNTLNLEPSTCVMIGNLYEKDIVGAKKAGLQTVLFDEGHQKKDFPDADVVIHNMTDLIKTIS